MPGIFGCYYYGEFILEKAEERFKSMSDTLQHKNDYFTIVNKVNHLYVGKKSFSSDPLKNIYSSFAPLLGGFGGKKSIRMAKKMVKGTRICGI